MEAIVADSQAHQYPLSWEEFRGLCAALADRIPRGKYKNLFPVLRGGVYPATEISRIVGLPVSWELSSESLVIDDICDSGSTLSKFAANDFAALHYKGNCSPPTYYAEQTKKWIQYPWESAFDIESTILRQIEYIGDNPTRLGVVETPKRVVKSWNELYSGYRQEPSEILSKRFVVERKKAEKSPVILRDIEFYSTCEHHMLPFFGTISLGYIPKNEVVGISKLARLVDCFSRRLQIQERMCEQIADSVMEELAPVGVYVKACAKHFCMMSRGIKKQNAVMESVAVRGEYEEIKELLNV